MSQYWPYAIGAVIRRLRKQKKMTLQQVAERMGRTRNEVWELEAGKRTPQIDTLDLLAVGLDIPLPELVALIEKEHEKIKQRVARGTWKPPVKRKPRPEAGDSI